MAKPLIQAGFSIRYVEAPLDDLGSINPAEADLLVVLGGPIGVHDEEAYPFLAIELEIVRHRLEAGRPLLGICLGAQLIAKALGARVGPGPALEIGWKQLSLTADGRSQALRHLDSTPVFHWHNDTFELPDGCALLASTDSCRNQAFSRGSNVLALQFHTELIAADIEHWLVGHACELAASQISPAILRSDTLAFGARLEEKSTLLASEWISGLSIATEHRKRKYTT